jgi:hypothetical protein
MKNAQSTQNQAVSKAELKRIKDAKDCFTSLLNRNLTDFKNLYLKSSVEYGIKMEKNSIENHIRMIQDSGRTEQQKVEAMKYVESRRRPEMLMTLEFINEANKSFNDKIESMVCKMIEAQITRRFLKLEKISGGTPTEFAFLISDDKIELHARTIFACGHIKAPHFRFITTTRNK